ncbi:DUF4142 domain-containing protein [Hymenobacter armeniacus]|uniref:DUF4142 domain-containing protein n=1 Tax=Hymenobacter armeniacus TaxID=2771358 RepID=A0ABR8JYN7_9BACT|nr:DUF4142 domain-containing protein [Hymenobacter armeniacus]MBD2723089.1 DUF4142 domain-containing protein [Hymenobacter armeniacus]
MLPFALAPLRRLFLGLALPVLGVSCSSPSGSDDAVNSATAQNEQKIDAADTTEKQEADAEFLVRATSSSLLEVELGKLLQARATVPAARAYGAAVVQQRLELLTALRALAATKKLAVPPALGGDEQAAYHEASTQPGAEFEKRAVALLVKAQGQDEDAFDDMKDDAYDGDIRGFAAKYHPAVEELLDRAKDVADAVDKRP